MIFTGRVGIDWKSEVVNMDAILVVQCVNGNKMNMILH